MKNLEMCGVQEMDAKEMRNVDGGMGYDAGGYGLVRYRSSEGAFYKGFIKGFYDAFFK